MFKKHSIQVKMVKDQLDIDTYENDVAKIHATALEADRFVNNVTKAVVIVVAVKTASELTLHLARTFIK